jgi:hypothetical protein
MNGQYCEREHEFVAALRIGRPDDAALAHAGHCPVCSEVLLVARLFQEKAKLSDHELVSLPDASLIWQKAQTRAREIAMKKATRPILIMRSCACALAVIASPWLAFQLTHLPAWFANLGLTEFPRPDGAWLAAFTGTTILGFSLTIVCVGLSSWYMLQEK